MNEPLFDSRAPKKATNLSINSDLLHQARKLEINLSQALEQKLAEIIRQERARRWKEENREAFTDYERFVEEHGVFSALRRRRR